MLTLTVAEIKDLAECAGFTLDPSRMPDADEMEAEITIIDCPKDGVLDDDNKPTHYAHIAYITEYPDEGSYPLGDQVEPKADICPKCDKPWELHEFAVPAPYCP